MAPSLRRSLPPALVLTAILAAPLPAAAEGDESDFDWLPFAQILVFGDVANTAPVSGAGASGIGLAGGVKLEFFGRAILPGLKEKGSEDEFPCTYVPQTSAEFGRGEWPGTEKTGWFPYELSLGIGGMCLVWDAVQVGLNYTPLAIRGWSTAGIAGSSLDVGLGWDRFALRAGRERQGFFVGAFQFEPETSGDLATWYVQAEVVPLFNQFGLGVRQSWLPRGDAETRVFISWNPHH